MDDQSSHSASARGSATLALGLATTVSMWGMAYVCRLPFVLAPAWLLLSLLLATVAVWGWGAGRYARDGWLAGARAGVVASVLNMLILGSLLSSEEGGGVVPSALWWVPASIAVVAATAAAAAAVGARSAGVAGDEPNWTALLTKVAAAATFLLVVAGGLVTSNEAGLAVVDWPNSFGYNMFLYPLSRMTGGVYYEHAHRLFGSLVGLATILVAIHLWRVEGRSWVRRLAVLAVLVVVVQGVLGGLRVTGHFTTSTSVEDMAPSLGLAVVHGVLGQLFLALMVAMAVVTGRGWRPESDIVSDADAGLDRSLHIALVGTLLVQLVLGAVQRHLAQGLVIHITLAAVVAMLAAVCGLRAWALHQGVRPIKRLGPLLLLTVTVQVVLGIAALAVTGGAAVVGEPSTLEVTIATAHQACGAALLAVSVALAAWTRRITGGVEG